MFHFVNINGYGNSTFIDNINVFAETFGVVDLDLGTISIYPNPTSEYVHIGINSMFGEQYKLKMTNSLGQNIFSNEGINEQNGVLETLNVSDLSSGLYFITIQVGGQSITKKLVIK